MEGTAEAGWVQACPSEDSVVPYKTGPTPKAPHRVARFLPKSLSGRMHRA
jgi:hypothetical protein